MRCGRMQGGRRRPGQPRHDLDHRIAGGGAFDDAAVDFDAPGVQQVLPRAAVDAVDHRAVEYQRHAFRRRRRAAQARLAKLPIGNDARRFSRIGDGQRALEFGDQQVRLIDLRGDQHAAGLDLDRRLVAAELRGGFVAIHLDAEWIAADALRTAGIDTAGLGLARTPAVAGDFRLAGGVVAEPAPAAGPCQRRGPNPAPMRTKCDQSGEDLWVFAYGSLMWRPGFGFLERRNARLVGAHRALCVYSFVHRGTPERPGLVLGLDRGGNCRGIAYRVAAAKRAATIDYLRAREQVTNVYREAWRSVWLDDDPQQSVHALGYMVDRGHRQYAGRLPLAQQLHYVRQGHGRSGACRDYVLAAVKELEAYGYRDDAWRRLAEQLKGIHETAAG